MLDCFLALGCFCSNIRFSGDKLLAQPSSFLRPSLGPSMANFLIHSFLVKRNLCSNEQLFKLLNKVFHSSGGA